MLVQADPSLRDEASTTTIQTIADAEEHLLDGLARFKPASAGSRGAVEDGGFLVKGKVSLVRTKRVDMRPLIKDTSDALGLDEVQCSLLLRRVQKEDQSELPAAVGPAMLLRLSQYYFMERASLLKTLQWLLMLRAAPPAATELGDGDDAPHPLSALTERLLVGGLEEKLCEQLKAVLSGDSLVCSAPQPSCGERVLSFWAGQAVLEATYLLESVFLIFYTDGDGMSAARFTGLVTMFHSTLFSTWPLLAAKLGWASEWLLRRLRQLATLILVEGMHLDRLLEALRGEPGAPTHPLLAPGAALEAHAALRQWQPTVEASPVLLAWAALLQLAGSVPGAPAELPSASELLLDASAPHALLQLAQAAAMWEVGGGSGAGEATDGSPLSHERELMTWVARMGLRDPLGAGRKSILKNVLITALVAFQFELPYLVDVFCALHDSERELCEQVHPAPNATASPPWLACAFGADENGAAAQSPSLTTPRFSLHH
jgi:hypothetical protein